MPQERDYRTELEKALDEIAPRDYQAELDGLIDQTLDVLDAATKAGVEVDPLAAIVGRLQARGESIDLSEAPPMMRMLLGGMMG